MEYKEFTEELKQVFMELLPIYIGKAHDRAETKIEAKGDGTPVTDLDNLALARLRELVTMHFPEDITIGEEDKKSNDEVRRILTRYDQGQWTIDGLDGTWHFRRGTNSYGAMIARRFGPAIRYAAIFRPVDMQLRGNGFFWAERKRGAWEWCSDCNKYHGLHTAAPGDLERTVVLLEGSSKRFYKAPIAHLGSTETTRPSLSSCIAATTVARGDATAVVTSGHSPWDAWPIILFTEESGGIVTDHHGRPYSVEETGNIVAAANAKDHTDIIELLRQG